ncbi:MAG: hypothetical protein IH620_07985, partial [Ignavibacterium sp.]|nr:hypothetical protein [Ignavibacterium sp.]
MLSSKKITSFVFAAFLLLFIYNSFGYLLLYFPARTFIKEFVSESIRQDKIEAEELSTISFNKNDLKKNKYDFVWVKPDKEFRFNGKMYDVKKQIELNDSIYFTCYYDEEENILEELFAHYFNSRKQDTTHNSALRIILVGLFSEEIKSFSYNLYDEDIINLPLLKKGAELIAPIKDIPTPPPRLA